MKKKFDKVAWGRRNRKTKKGLIAECNGRMRERSRNRGHAMPNFTIKELHEWFNAQPNFDTLYNNWVDSDYDKWLKPSPDRIDSKLPYTFENLQLDTWRKNHENNTADILAAPNQPVGKGTIYHVKDRGHWRATCFVEGKEVYIKTSTDKQVAIDALKEFKKNLEK